MKSISVGTLIGSLVLERAEHAFDRGITIATDIQAHTATFDAEQIRRALDNLILNAIEAAPMGSQIFVGASVEGDMIRLSVRDAGAAPPASLNDHLFEPFVTGRPDGTGLGLSLVREIVIAHGGTARFLSDENGTTFDPRSMAIVLAVDDDPAMREALGEALIDMGHEPRLADSGATALAALERDPIDAAFIDLRMPGMWPGLSARKATLSS